MTNPQHRIVCSECGTVFWSRRADAKTDKPKCRAARSRRLRREADKRDVMPAHQREVTDIVRGELPDIARPLVEEELRPVIREAITEETMRAVQRMVGLTPAAVAALQQDLESTNSQVRQRAYTLILKYTVGHPAVVRPDDADPNRQLVVNFAFPRPGSPTPDELPRAPIETDALEYRECQACHESKVETEFIGESDRCQECHTKLLERAKQYLDQQPDDSAT